VGVIGAVTDGQYAAHSGTSVSAALVAGDAALPYDSARIMAANEISNNWLEPAAASVTMWDDAGWSFGTDTLEAWRQTLAATKIDAATRVTGQIMKAE
jgi:hypothetical protein